MLQIYHYVKRDPFIIQFGMNVATQYILRGMHEQNGLLAALFSLTSSCARRSLLDPLGSSSWSVTMVASCPLHAPSTIVRLEAAEGIPPETTAPS